MVSSSLRSSGNVRDGSTASMTPSSRLYSRGLSTRAIQEYLKELYGVDVSPSLLSSVTDDVIDEVKTWQARPLDSIYPIVYLDAIRVKIRDEGSITNKAVYLALGINLSGNKELLGLWTAQNEGAKFWMSVLTELQNRGVSGIFLACGVVPIPVET